MAREVGTRIEEIQHFSHEHPLRFVYLGAYKCDGCQENGYGFIYYCRPCDFGHHESCARAAKSIHHSCHPQHPLVFREKPVSPDRVCDVCGKEVLGFLYDCRGCGVDVHPSCAKLPAMVRHPLHPHHTLQLLLYTYTPQEAEAAEPPARICNVCGEACPPGRWSYRCEAASTPACDFNLHISCAKLPVDPFEEIIMQSISPLEVPRHNSAATNSSAATSSTGVQAPQAELSPLEAQVELMKIQNKMMVASAAYDVNRAFALNSHRHYY